MNEPCRLLFVYGTLRRDSAHPMARYLEGVSRFLDKATTPGRLYDFGWHPALAAAQETGERVHGHLLEMTDPEAVLVRLDAYEAEPVGFERTLAEVVDEAGRQWRAWVYVYTGPLSAARRISSGDFATQAGNLAR